MTRWSGSGVSTTESRSRPTKQVRSESSPIVTGPWYESPRPPSRGQQAMSEPSTYPAHPRTVQSARTPATTPRPTSIRAHGVARELKRCRPYARVRRYRQVITESIAEKVFLAEKMRQNVQRLRNSPQVPLRPANASAASASMLKTVSRKAGDGHRTRDLRLGKPTLCH